MKYIFEIKNGQIAVVLVNGDEATLKRVKYLNESIILYPDNHFSIIQSNCRYMGTSVERRNKLILPRPTAVAVGLMRSMGFRQD